VALWFESARDSCWCWWAVIGESDLVAKWDPESNESNPSSDPETGVSAERQSVPCSSLDYSMIWFPWIGSSLYQMVHVGHDCCLRSWACWSCSLRHSKCHLCPHMSSIISCSANGLKKMAHLVLMSWKSGEFMVLSSNQLTHDEKKEAWLSSTLR
jgi:hypothetical protein